MRIYLAGPMRGIPDYNFPEFHKYAAMLRAQGHEVFNPAEIDLPQDQVGLIMAIETDWICKKAEAVYLMPGWTQSRGAIAERALAEALDRRVIYSSLETPPYESPSLSERRFSTTFPSHLRQSLESHSLDRNSTIPQVGTALNRQTTITASFAIILSAVLLTQMGLPILLKWLGAV